MTTFYERLSVQMSSLDAAIPPPSIAAPRLHPDVVATPSLRGRSKARRRLVLLAAAAALVIGTGVAIGGRLMFPVQPEPALEAAIAQLFDAEDCLQPAEAEVKIRALFEPLGYEGWDIERTAPVRDDVCVAAAVDSEHHAVLLMPGVSRTSMAMFEALQAELLARCLGKDAAIEFVRSGFASVGVDDVAISTGDRPLSIPGDEAEAARWQQHVANGCYVLSGGATWDEAGNRTIHLWGN